jgi:sterol 24-C-methyltransferase
VPFVWETLVRLAPPAGTVVDVGCGPALYRDAFKVRYIGVDITDEPYSEGVPRQPDLVATAQAIPLGDESADLVFTLSSLYQMGDADPVLKEFRRILRPGGRLLIFDYNRRMRQELARKYGPSFSIPRWSQWRLRREIRRAGYRRVRLLAPVGYDARGLDRLRRLIDEELRGQWAVVTAIR